MKKTLGYGYKLSSESLEEGLSYFSPNSLCKTKKEVLIQIGRNKIYGTYPKNVKFTIFKVVIETI